VELIETRGVTSTLFLNNPYDAGDWGFIGLCPEYSFVHAFEILVSVTYSEQTASHTFMKNNRYHSIINNFNTYDLHEILPSWERKKNFDSQANVNICFSDVLYVLHIFKTYFRLAIISSIGSC
jgi:hypothetical protein